MTTEFPDELISAYLDGELTGDDKSRVEELLMDSVEHRRMFNELRALRDSLKSLPRYSLGDDFADKVVRQTERVMTVPVTPTDVWPVNESPVNLPSSNRRVVWAMVAVAASLLIAIVYPSLSGLLQNPKPEIANVDPSEEGETTESLEENIGGKAGQHPADGFISQPDNSNAADPVVREKAATSDAPLAGAMTKPGQGLAGDAGPPFENGAQAETESIGAQRRGANSVPSIAADDADLLGVTESRYAELFDRAQGEPIYVYVDVPRDEFEKQVVDSSLSANGIAMIDGRDQLARSLGALNKSLDDAPAGDSARAEDKVANEAADFRLRRSSLDGDTIAALVSSDVDLLVVNATSRQIQMTCDHLRAKGYALTIQHNAGGQSDEKQQGYFGGGPSAGASPNAPADAAPLDALKDDERLNSRGRGTPDEPAAPAKTESKVAAKPAAVDEQVANAKEDKKESRDGSDNKSDHAKNIEDAEKEFAGKRPAAPVGRSYAFRLERQFAKAQFEASKHNLTEKLDAVDAPGQGGGSAEPSAAEPSAAADGVRGGRPSPDTSTAADGVDRAALKLAEKDKSATAIDSTTVQVIFVIRPIDLPVGNAKAAESPSAPAPKE